MNAMTHTGFTDQQIASLSADLDIKNVSQRDGGGGRKLSYIEGWHAIAEGNRIFGFDRWSSETLEMRNTHGELLKTDGRQMFVCGYAAKVRITVIAGDRTIVREGFGFGNGRDRDTGQSHEKAIKEAETDARKRALMTFGNPFGLALYDKEQTNVSSNVDDSLPSPQAQASAERIDPETGEVLDNLRMGRPAVPANTKPAAAADDDVFPPDRRPQPAARSQPETRASRPAAAAKPATRQPATKGNAYDDKAREVRSRNARDKLLDGDQNGLGLRRLYAILKDNSVEPADVAEQFAQWKERARALKASLFVPEHRDAVIKGFEALTTALETVGFGESEPDDAGSDQERAA